MSKQALAGAITSMYRDQITLDRMSTTENWREPLASLNADSGVEEVLQLLLDIKHPEQLKATLGAIRANEYPQVSAQVVDEAIRKFIGSAAQELEETNAQYDELRFKLSWAEPLIANFGKWVHEAEQRKGLEANNHTRLHRLIEALKGKRVWMSGELNEFTRPEIEADLADANVFVVQHDWAGALSEAIDQALGDTSTEAVIDALEEGYSNPNDIVPDGDESSTFRLPFDRCVFEFQVAGRCVCLVCNQAPGAKASALAMIEFGQHWMVANATHFHQSPVFRQLWRQVLAACVALEAGVAVHAVADSAQSAAALNKKRAKAGKPLIAQFRVVTLAKSLRGALANPQPGDSPGPGKVRLHFRRGHFRQYSGYKRWIRWMLVGNPSIGFIAKEYRL